MNNEENKKVEETTFFRVYTRNGKDLEIDLLANNPKQLRKTLLMAQLSIYRVCKQHHITPDELLEMMEESTPKHNKSTKTTVKA